jgi:acyl carrier protein
VITREDIKRLLLERKLYASVPGDLDFDAELAFDSLSLIWFLHVLEQEYGIHLSPEDSDFNEFTSVNSIHRYIEGHLSKVS